MDAHPPLSAAIFDVRRFSIHDGPGIRTTIFFKGCPLHCWWCHNPESQSPKPEVIVQPGRCIRCGACVEACPQEALSQPEGEPAPLPGLEVCTVCGTCVAVCPAEARQLAGRQVTVAELLAEIERDQLFFDESGGGVTLSGGEPLMQPAFLLELLKTCQAHDLHTALDTCGYASWRMLEPISHFVDVFLFDLKLVDSELHRRYTGASNARILANLRRLSQNGAAIIIRLPVIPGITDTEDNLHQVASFLKKDVRLQRIDLLPYHRAAVSKYSRLNLDYTLVDTLPPSQDRLRDIKLYLEQFGFQVKIGG